jgi:hypothetical protein
VDFWLKKRTTWQQAILLAIVILCSAKVSTGQSLPFTKITAREIAQFLAVPDSIVVYDPEEQCSRNPPTRAVSCDPFVKKDPKKGLAVVATDEEGQPQITSCRDMRIFRFSCDYPNPNVDAISVLISQCKDGPFGKSNVAQSVQRIQKWGEKITTSISKNHDGEERKQQSPWAELKVLHLDKYVTAYLFGIVLVGHGVGFIPTGVLVDTRESTTLVAQLSGPQRDTPDAGPLIQHLGDRPLEAMEALIKGLYQARKR